MLYTSVSFPTHDGNVVRIFSDSSTVLTPVVGQHIPRTGSLHFVRKDTGTAFRLGLCSIARDLSVTTETAA